MKVTSLPGVPSPYLSPGFAAFVDFPLVHPPGNQRESVLACRGLLGKSKRENLQTETLKSVGLLDSWDWDIKPHRPVARYNQPQNPYTVNPKRYRNVCLVWVYLLFLVLTLAVNIKIKQESVE